MKRKKGFTLVELVVYMGIAVLLLSLIVTLYVSLTRARVKHQTIAEVENQGVEVMNAITQAIRNAQDITSPTMGQTLSALTIKTYLASTTPLIFNSASSSIRIKEGTESAMSISSNHVVISNVLFQNLSSTSTLETIKIQFTASRATTTSNRSEYIYSKIFYGSATMRKFQ